MLEICVCVRRTGLVTLAPGRRVATAVRISPGQKSRATLLLRVKRKAGLFEWHLGELVASIDLSCITKLKFR